MSFRISGRDSSHPFQLLRGAWLQADGWAFSGTTSTNERNRDWLWTHCDLHLRERWPTPG